MEIENLTDQQIKDLFFKTLDCGGGWALYEITLGSAVQFARAVEAAVLAKLEGAVWLMPNATDEPGDSRLQRFAWGNSDLTTGQMAHAYDCIIKAAQECGQVIPPPKAKNANN